MALGRRDGGAVSWPRPLTALWALAVSLLVGFSLLLHAPAVALAYESSGFSASDGSGCAAAATTAYDRRDRSERGYDLAAASVRPGVNAGQRGPAQIGETKSDLEVPPACRPGAYGPARDVFHTYYVTPQSADGSPGTAAVLVHNSDCPIGPKMKYERNPKHDQSRPGVGSQPRNPQQMLDESFLFNSNSGRRVAYDAANDEIVVFAKHAGGRYHGYVEEWATLPQAAKNVLIKEGRFTSRGRTR